MRAQAHLLGRFFAGDVEHGQTLGDGGGGLQQQRGLADAGVAADQHHRARHQSAAEHAVQLGDAGRRAGLLLRCDLGEGQDLARVQRRGALPRTGPAAATRRQRRGGHLVDAVPGAAVRALAGPLRLRRAAGVADVGAARLFRALGHGVNYIVAVGAALAAMPVGAALAATAVGTADGKRAEGRGPTASSSALGPVARSRPGGRLSGPAPLAAKAAPTVTVTVNSPCRCRDCRPGSRTWCTAPGRRA